MTFMLNIFFFCYLVWFSAFFSLWERKPEVSFSFTVWSSPKKISCFEDWSEA